MKYLSRRKYLFLFKVALLFLFACGKNNSSDTFYYPADFEPTASTSFIWTTDFYEIVPQIAGIISRKDRITLYIDEKEDLDVVNQVLERHQGNLSNIHFIKLQDAPRNAWIRDFGPVILNNKKGQTQVVDFKYFGKILSFNEQIAALKQIPFTRSSLNSSGGAREVNGKGTMILCESHELSVNKDFTLQEIEQAYIDALDLKKVIWLKEGIPQDDSELNGPLYDLIYPNGVHGHVDEFCRFVNANTVLISTVTEEEAKKHPILAEAKKRLDTNYEILVNSTDQDGKKLNVVKVPFAPLLVFERPEGEGSKYLTLVTSYMNFIVTNSLVIMPSYVSSAKDFNRSVVAGNEDKAAEILKNAFPGKEIIKVPAEDLNRFSGGFHCISLNLPFI
jgi:agmatine deiminase